MAPKKNAGAAAATIPRPVTPTTPSAAAAVAAKRSSTTSTTTTKGGAASWDVVFQNIYTHYVKETAQRTKLIDVFLVFLAVVGALQFAYCVLAGNYVRPLATMLQLNIVRLLTNVNSPLTLSSLVSPPPSASSSSPVCSPMWLAAPVREIPRLPTNGVQFLSVSKQPRPTRPSSLPCPQKGTAANPSLSIPVRLR